VSGHATGTQTVHEALRLMVGCAGSKSSEGRLTSSTGMMRLM